MVRSWDGLTLYAASSDGTLAAFQFDPTELEGIATADDQEQYLAKFGFVSPPLPEGYSHVPKNEPKTPMPQAQKTNGFNNSTGPERVNILVAKRAPKDKKRATLLPSNPASVPTSRNNNISQSQYPPSSSRQPSNADKHMVPASSNQDAISSFSRSFPAPSEQIFAEHSDHHSWGNQAMDLDVPIDSFDNVSSKGKRKASAVIDLMDSESKAIRPRTLGGDRPVEPQVSKPISRWTASAPPPRPVESGSSSLLPALPLLTYLSSPVDGTSDLLEAKNIETSGTPFCQVQHKLSQLIKILHSRDD